MSSDRTLQHLRTFLFALSAVICLATPVELLAAEHYKEPLQVIPFILSALGFVMVLIALWRPHRRTLLWLRGIMAGLVLGSLIGVVLHFSGNLGFAREIDPTASLGQTWLTAFQGADPLLAPGILALAGFLAVAATYRHPSLDNQNERFGE